jgi:hypothetical protein
VLYKFSEILLMKKVVVNASKKWLLMSQLVHPVGVLLTYSGSCNHINDQKVVVVIINVVINTLISTTTYCLVLEKLTTGNSMWSLIVLATELLATMDDHTLWSLIPFNDYISRRYYPLLL